MKCMDGFGDLWNTHYKLTSQKNIKTSKMSMDRGLVVAHTYTHAHTKECSVVLLCKSVFYSDMEIMTQCLQWKTRIQSGLCNLYAAICAYTYFTNIQSIPGNNVKESDNNGCLWEEELDGWVETKGKRFTVYLAIIYWPLVPCGYLNLTKINYK